MSDLADTAASDLVRIVYISRSTFTTMPAEMGIEPSVARILAQSRINNARRGLVGALYFGDGCFFQCLEGRAEAVDRLYDALLKDPRHTDLKVLTRRPIARTGFSSWAMKYVPLDADMKALLAEFGLESFDPYRFNDGAVARVLEILSNGNDLAGITDGEPSVSAMPPAASSPSVSATPQTAAPAPATTPRPAATAVPIAPPAPARRGPNPLLIGGAVAAAVILIVALVLMR